MMLRIAVGILVLGLGAALGFAFSGGSSSGTVITGTKLPTVTTIATTTPTVAIVAPLQTTTTTTVPKVVAPKVIVHNVTHVVTRP